MNWKLFFLTLIQHLRFYYLGNTGKDYITQVWARSADEGIQVYINLSYKFTELGLILGTHVQVEEAKQRRKVVLWLPNKSYGIETYWNTSYTQTWQ